MADATIFINALSIFLQQIGKEGAKYIVTKIFPKNDDGFRKVAQKALTKVDKQFNQELFGGSMVTIMTQPESLKILERYINPFEEPSAEDFEAIIDLDNLPPNFLSVLKSFLLAELYGTPIFKERIVDLFQTIQQDNMGIAIAALSDSQTKAFDEVLGLLKQLLARNENIGRPQKRCYEGVCDYIPRILYPIAEQQGPYAAAKHSLIDLVKEKKRIIVLSSAGLGKSTEIKNLANHFSSEESSAFPILIKLNTYTNQEINALLAKECNGWENISQEELLVIFDGLDEVHVDYFEIFISKLFLFNKEFKDASIVVTCRDNFISPIFSSREQNGFSVFKLKELSHWDVITHARKKLGEDLGNKFISQVQTLDLFDIVSSPFFMTFLLEVFQRDGVLPVSKVDLFEKLIDHRIEQDTKRFALKGIKIDKRIGLIRKQIGRLALIMETAGRNYISNEEFELLIPDYENNRELIEHTFLFDQSKTSIWQFEHNNFQEFLAAKVLSGKSLKEIKGIVALPPDHHILRPTWVNTLSFLFVLIDEKSSVFQSLLSWLIDNDKELLLRFEKDRAALSIREKIFEDIIKEYESKGILTRSEKFDVTDLARFVSDSRRVIDFLLNRLKGSRSSRIIGETCRMLSQFKYLNEYRNNFQVVLEGIIRSSQTPTEGKYYALSALAELGWQTKTSFETILPILVLENQYERAGVFLYLTNCGFQDDYIDLIIKISSRDQKIRTYKNKRPARTNTRLGDESINREACFLSISSLDGVSKMLRFFRKSQQGHGMDSLVGNVLKHGLLDKVATLIRQGNDKLLKDVVKLFITLTKYDRKEKAEPFIEFFNASGTMNHAARLTLESAKLNKEGFDSLAMITDEKFATSLVEQFAHKKLTEEQVWSIRNSLKWTGSTKAHEIFYEGVNKISGNKFLYIDNGIDWKKVREDRLKMDLDLLMNRDQFISRIRKVYELEGKDTIGRDDLWDFKKKYLSDENYFDNNITLDFLRHDKNTPLHLDEATTCTDENWELYQINTLIRYDSQDLNTLGEREIGFIKLWCDKQISIADFRTAIDENTYRYLEIFLAYCIRRFNFLYNDTVYLDLLWVDSNCLIRKISHGNRGINAGEKNLGDWVISKVGLAKVRQRVLENFKTGIKNSSVLRHHVALCGRHGIKEALPFIQDVLKTLGPNTYDLVESCEDFLRLGGNVTVVENILASNSSLDKQDRSRVIEMLIKYASTWVVDFMEFQIDKDDGNQKSYATYLMKLGKIKGLIWYKDWVRKYKKFDDFIGSQEFLSIPPDESLPVLLEMVEIYLQPGFEREHLHSQDQDLFGMLCKIGSENENNYNVVKERFESYIRSYDAKIFHYYLKRMDQLYYTNLATSMSLPEIANQIDVLLA